MSVQSFDDQPLTLTDLYTQHEGVDLLAERVASHLGEGWEVTVDLFKVMLHGPGGEMLRLNPHFGPRQEHLLMIRPYSSDGESLTVCGNPGQLNLFLLPSQIAAAIDSEVLPPYRKRLVAVQAQIAAEQRVKDAQRTTLAKIAARLGDRWDLTEDTYGPKVVCTRKTKRVWGDVRFNTIAKGQHGMFLHLRNLPPAVAAHIVDVVADYNHGIYQEAPMWLDPNDDGAQCRDFEGTTYPEHAEIGVGVFAAECRRCGAELDLDNDESEKEHDEH